MDNEYTPRKKATLNMVQFRADYNKIKSLTKTTHERYLLEILRGYIIENIIKTEIGMKKKDGERYE